jgi:solute carrier family 41
MDGAVSNAKYVEIPGSDDREAFLSKESVHSRGSTSRLNLSTLVSRDWIPTTTVEASLSIAVQVFPPFLVAGCGMVAAGLLLGLVQYWPVFREVQEILVLVPALLGLKGNLEMTLASRLGTHANLGDLDGGRFWTIVFGNLAVVQCQAIVVGFLAALVAVSTDSLFTGTLSISHALLLASSGITAASVASCVLACIMVAIVIFSRRWGINPDNVASPIAGMLGDFCTLGLLSTFAQLFWSSDVWMQWMVLVAYLFFAPICAWIAFHNKTAGPLRESWTPVILSMLISCVAGFILKEGVHTFKHLAPFAPVMNGAGGNLAAVHASRLSTDLHASHASYAGAQSQSNERRVIRKEISRMGMTAEDMRTYHQCLTPQPDLPVYRKLSWYEPDRDRGFARSFLMCSALRGEGGQARTARILALLTLPGSTCFASLIVGVKSGWSAWPSPIFILVYVAAALFQVIVLLMIAHLLVSWLWSRGYDPDNAAIPYVTSLGDVVGTASLTAAFTVLSLVGATPWDEIGSQSGT